MRFPEQLRTLVTYMRGGGSKGVFSSREDLSPGAQRPGRARKAFLLRVIGSPSLRPDQDVDYLLGRISIGRTFVAWSGNPANVTCRVLF